MKAVRLYVFLAALLVSPIFIWVACGGNNNNVFFDAFGFVCIPDGFEDATDPLALNFAVFITDRTQDGDPAAGQTVNLEFGTGITSAINLNDGDAPFDIDGDQTTSDSNGDISVEADCADLADTDNPCTVTFSMTVDGQTYSCTGGFQE